MFARFDENPAITLQDIKKTKRDGRTDAHTHGQRENSIPTTNKVCGGYKNFFFQQLKIHECLLLFSTSLYLEWLENNGSKCENDRHFPHLPLLFPININCHPYTSHFRLPK